MKYTTILSTTLMALFLTTGNVMADEDVDKERTRTEATERMNMQEDGEQTRTQSRTRSEDGEGNGEQNKHQYRHSYQHKHQGANGSRSGGGSRR